MISTDCNKSLQYKISRKPVGWEPSLYMRTDPEGGGGGGRADVRTDKHGEDEGSFS
jgi:hypothetical protein